MIKMVSNLFIITVICLLLKGEYCEGTDVFAEAGSMVVLPCTAAPQRVYPAIIWKKDHSSVWKMQRNGLQFWNRSWMSRVQCPHTQFERGDFSLQIRSVRAEDAGVYSCTLELHEQKPVTTLVTLRVVTVSLSPAAPVLGQGVTVTCTVSGRLYGEPRVRWRLNSGPYEPQDVHRRVSRMSAGTAALTVKASDSVKGKWTCVVDYMNMEGSASALLDVKGIVQPPDNSTKIYAAVGSDVSLPCVFSQDLTTSNVLWQRSRDKSTSQPGAGTLPPSFSTPAAHVSSWDRTAGLREVSFEDAGRYSCSGTVSGFRMERSMQLVTAKVGVEVLSEKDSTLALTCHLSDTSSITTYEWVYEPSDLNGTRFVVSVQESRVVTLSQASEGQWTCRFYGEQGVLGNVTYYVQRMERLSEEKPKSVSHPAVILTGLCVLLVILVLTLIQMYRNYQRRSKILQYPALETVIHVRSVEREMSERSQTKL